MTNLHPVHMYPPPNEAPTAAVLPDESRKDSQNDLDYEKICVYWLQAVDELSPATGQAPWSRIVENWVEFLSDSCIIPLINNQPAWLAISSGDSARTGNRGTMDEGSRPARRRRELIRLAMEKGLTSAEDQVRAFGAPAHRIMNSMYSDGIKPVSFVCLRDSRSRTLYQAIWWSMISFITYSYQKGTLSEMGLQLTKGSEKCLRKLLDWFQKRDSSDASALHDLWLRIYWFIIVAIDQWSPNSHDNPLLWWMSILVRSATSTLGYYGVDDFISRGGYTSNPMPMDLNIMDRVEAMMHYSKVLTTMNARTTWHDCEKWIFDSPHPLLRLLGIDEFCQGSKDIQMLAAWMGSRFGNSSRTLYHIWKLEKAFGTYQTLLGVATMGSID